MPHLALLLDKCRKFLVLRKCFALHPLHRQQSVLPLVVEKQPLLGAVAQMALVHHPAPGHALAQAQFFQQILHLRGVVTRHGQIVRAQGAVNAIQRPATRVATRAVFKLQHGKVLLATQPQRTCCRESGDTAASNQHLGPEHAGGCGPISATFQQVTQRMPTLERCAREAASDVRKRGLRHTPRQPQHGAGSCLHESATLHQELLQQHENHGTRTTMPKCSPMGWFD